MTSRRSFLGIAGGSLAGLAAAPPAWARRPLGAAQAIAESFVFDEWRAAMDRAVAERGDRGGRAFWATFGSGAPADAPAGTLLALPAPGVELFAADEARALAALANDRLAERVRADGAIAGLATISARDRHAAREAERAIAGLGLAGLALGANRAVRLDDRALWPLYDYAQSARVAIYLPAAYAPGAGDAPYRALGAPGILAGAAADSAKHAAQLIFGGVLDAFPLLQVVLARLGEGTPYWHGEMGATYATLRASGGRLPRRPAERYFETNIALTSADMTSPETLAYCGEVIGRPPLRSRDGAALPDRVATARLADADAVPRGDYLIAPVTRLIPPCGRPMWRPA